MSESLLLVRPATLLRWHRDLVRRKWTCTRRRPGGRPPLGAAFEGLSLRLAEENPRGGYSRLHGELRKLGYTLSRSTVRDILRRRRVPPAPARGRRGESGRRFLGQHRDQLLACDCFTAAVPHPAPCQRAARATAPHRRARYARRPGAARPPARL